MTEPGPGLAHGLALALAADLRDLAVDLAAGGYTRSTLAMLERNLRRSIPSALGATIAHLRGPGHRPVLVNLVTRTLQPDEIRAVLRIPLRLPEPTSEAAITVYAGEPGAFNDLVTGLTGTLDVAVEQHLAVPDGPVEAGVTGLIDLTVVNVALGHLLNRGRTLDQAKTELARIAEQNRTDLVDAAHTLLDR